jgi:hypothetical protein
MKTKGVFILLLILMFLLTGCFLTNSKQKMAEFESKIIETLTTKYNKDFEIISTSKKGNESTGHFYISEVKCLDDGIIFTSEYNTDNYLSKRWSIEATSFYGSIFEDRYGDCEYSVKFSTRKDNQIGAEKLTYKEITERITQNNPGQSYIEITSIVYKNDTFDTTAESEFIYELLNMEPMNIIDSTFTIRIVYVEGESKNLNIEYPNSRDEWHELISKKYTIANFVADFIYEISSPEDIYKKFEVYK